MLLKWWKQSLPIFFSIIISCTTSNEKVCEKDFCQENGVKIYSELNGLDQYDPKVIEKLKNDILVKPSHEPLNLSRPPQPNSLKGQYGQPYGVEDILKEHKLWKKIKKRKKQPGFFIEAGACGGEHLSNSLYFEVKHNWTGLLAEPSPDFHDQLIKKNRKAWILPHCLSTTRKVETVEFDAAKFNGGIIQPDKILPSDLGREVPRTEEKRWGKTITAQCFPLQSVLVALGNPIVDYFSLDVEGSEFPILKSLDWDNVNISIISVEMNHAGDIFEGTFQDIRDFMDSKGYAFVGTIKIDDIFLKKELMKK